MQKGWGSGGGRLGWGTVLHSPWTEKAPSQGQTLPAELLKLSYPIKTGVPVGVNWHMQIVHVCRMVRSVVVRMQILAPAVDAP